MRPGGRDRAFRLIDVPIHEQLLTADPRSVKLWMTL